MTPLLAALQQVTYYGPFTHYVAADVLRASILVIGAVLVICFIVLGLASWKVNRPIALALLSFAVSLTSQTSASAVGFGHPPVWWLLDLRALVLVFAATTFGVLIREMRSRD